MAIKITLKHRKVISSEELADTMKRLLKQWKIEGDVETTPLSVKITKLKTPTRDRENWLDPVERKKVGKRIKEHMEFYMFKVPATIKVD